MKLKLANIKLRTRHRGSEEAAENREEKCEEPHRDQIARNFAAARVLYIRVFIIVICCLSKIVYSRKMR